MKRISLVFMSVVAASFACSAGAYAEDYVLTLKDHQFSPKELVIPAHEKVKITVKNDDATPAEFESSDLDREKVVGANNKIVVYVGPLNPGSYGFFDDFHRDSTAGNIVVK